MCVEVWLLLEVLPFAIRVIEQETISDYKESVIEKDTVKCDTFQAVLPDCCLYCGEEDEAIQENVKSGNQK